MNAKHYVPVLKAKMGEHWALASLKPSSKKRITPVLEIPTIPKPAKGKTAQPLADFIKKKVKEIADKWGTGLCYLDSRWLSTAHGDKPLPLIFDAARKLGIKAIPVAYPGSTAATRKAIKAIVDADKAGVLIRTKSNDLDNLAEIKQLMSDLGVKADGVDLLIDYRSQPMSLPVEIAKVMLLGDIKKWRALIAASGVFPVSVASFKDGAWHSVSRTCWTTWKVGQKGLARIPTFGDYAIRSPGAPAAGGDPPVTLRYTTDNDWLVRVEGSLQGGDAKKMHALCAELIQRAEYAGKAFSAGDLEIEKTATFVNPTPGAATQWLQWAASHHLEHVVHQLA